MLDTIKKLCEERGITMRKLENDLGFSHGCMQRWDSGGATIEKVKTVAAYFGISIDELVNK